MTKKRYRIELLETADGVNLKLDRTEDVVIVFLWEKNLTEANNSAHKIAASLSIALPMGSLEYIIQGVHECEVPAAT